MTPGMRRYWLILQLVAIAAGIWAGVQAFRIVTT